MFVTCWFLLWQLPWLWLPQQPVLHTDWRDCVSCSGCWNHLQQGEEQAEILHTAHWWHPMLVHTSLERSHRDRTGYFFFWVSLVCVCVWVCVLCACVSVAFVCVFVCAWYHFCFWRLIVTVCLLWSMFKSCSCWCCFKNRIKNNSAAEEQ